MTFFKAAPAVFGVALLAAAFSPIVKADEYNKDKTIVTQLERAGNSTCLHHGDESVASTGTYVFKLVNSSSNRHIVQIFNAAETKIYATILAVPNYRLEPKDKTVITFNEGLAGQPEAIRAWFYPGANWGEEFVYPKAKAVELAQVSKQPVLAHQSEVEVEVAKPEEPQVVAQLAQAPIVAIQPTGEVVEVAPGIAERFRLAVAQRPR